MEINSISKLTPIFFNCAPDFTLQINNQTVTECIIELYPTQILTVNSFSEKTHVIDLQLLMNSDCYLQSCIVNSVICLAPRVERYPNLLVIKEINLINFEENPISLDVTKPLLTLHIYYPENKHQLIQVQKLHFEGLYSNLIECQQLNSIQYLSALLSKQLLNQNELNSEAKILEINSALLYNQKENLFDTYEKSFKDLENIDYLFNLIFVSKDDFDKKSFILAQKLIFPKLYFIA